MKPLIELTTEQYKSLMHQASDALRLRDSSRDDRHLCDLDEAEMFRRVAKQFCPDAVPQIEKAIRFARFPWLKREAMSGVTLATKLQS